MNRAAIPQQDHRTPQIPEQLTQKRHDLPQEQVLPFYRLCVYVAGKRRMTSFASYAQAKAEPDKLVKDLAKGSQVAALSPAQARDALAALERLQSFYQSTGRRAS